MQNLNLIWKVTEIAKDTKKSVYESLVLTSTTIKLYTSYRDFRTVLELGAREFPICWKVYHTTDVGLVFVMTSVWGAVV